jgi:RNA polymerase sigma-70 factor (ECF subfamily)
LKKDSDISKEQSLLIAYQESGELSSLGELYKPYMPLVYGLCLKYLKDKEKAQDAVMEIFEELEVKLKKFEVDNFKSWLYVLAKNHCLMLLRSEKKRNSESLSENHLSFMESEAALHHTSEDKLEKEMELEKLESCIAQLKEEQKLCVELFYLQQKSYKEIEEQTKLELKKVKSFIQNGKRNLKICMEAGE